MHTPGPWEVDLDDVPDQVVERDIVAPNAFGNGGAGLVLGRVMVCRASDEFKANARLMAAAPELLKACRALVEIGRSVLSSVHDNGVLPYGKTDHEVLLMAIEAIEKAGVE